MGEDNRDFGSLGSRIKYARNFAGFNREDLAAKLGIPLSHLIDYEKESTTPDQKTLKEISRLCNFDIYWLETGLSKYGYPLDEGKGDSKG